MFKRRRSSSFSEPAFNSKRIVAKPGFRRRSYRRSFARVQRPFPGTGGGLRTRQFVYTAVLSQVASVPAFGAAAMSLSQLPQVATFGALFDQYRVDYMEFTFRPRYPDNTIVSPATALPPLIYTVIDKDDSSAATTLAQLQEYQSCETHGSSVEQFTRRFKPGCRGLVWDGAAAQPGLCMTSPWLDIAYTTTVHYGMKYGCTAGPAALTLQSWDIDLYVGLSFKNLR